jgi:tRNA-Thr(GGU) m(6)t(6)A37 methyltransferase TsaA
MVRENEVRLNEISVDVPDGVDAGLVFIGRIHSPWTSRLETPRQGRHDGPLCTIEIFEPWVAALKGIEKFERLEVLYWLDRSRRDLVLQSPASNGEVHGTFSIRSPVRPNPIGTSIVVLEKVEGAKLYVRGMDCLDGTPLIDIKPDRTLFKPIAPPQKGDFETGESSHCQKSETGKA